MKFTIYIAAALAFASVAMAADKPTTTGTATGKHTSVVSTHTGAPIVVTGAPTTTATVPSSTTSVAAPITPTPTKNAAANSVVMNSVASVAGLALAVAAAL